MVAHAIKIPVSMDFSFALTARMAHEIAIPP
jgi:hypothetical protein